MQNPFIQDALRLLKQEPGELKIYDLLAGLDQQLLAELVGTDYSYGAANAAAHQVSDVVEEATALSPATAHPDASYASPSIEKPVASVQNAGVAVLPAETPPGMEEQWPQKPPPSPPPVAVATPEALAAIRESGSPRPDWLQETPPRRAFGSGEKDVSKNRCPVHKLTV